jgi:hypothetical protein
MTAKYRRTWKITFFNKDNIEILNLQESMESVNPLRITFWVRQLIYLVNYMSRFEVYNLSEDTLSLLVDAESMTLEVGYAGELKLLHRGNIVQMFHLRRQPDYVLILATQDLLINARPIDCTLPMDLTDREAIKRVASLISPPITVNDDHLQGLTDKPTMRIIGIQHLTYTAALKKVADEINVNAWITNQTLYTSSKSSKSIDSIPAKDIVLNYKNGMIGSPQIDVANAGITVKALMDAEIIPGRFIKVESLAPKIQLAGANFVKFSQEQATRGTWEIFSVDHVGDSRGEEWHSNVSGFGAALVSGNQS